MHDISRSCTPTSQVARPCSKALFFLSLPMVMTAAFGPSGPSACAGLSLFSQPVRTAALHEHSEVNATMIGSSHHDTDTPMRFHFHYIILHLCSHRILQSFRSEAFFESSCFEKRVIFHREESISHAHLGRASLNFHHLVWSSTFF